MDTRREIFDASGPLHLPTSLDWGDTSHRRSLAASLVQGVYNLAHDRQSGSTPHQHDAPSSQWWERFHFQLNRELVDEKDSCFGAIYEHKYAHPHRPYPPRYVIAFRGTTFKLSELNQTIQDIKVNMKCAIGKLEDSRRFDIAFEAVWNIASNVGPARVWLAGHSLGAAMAMLVGRNMAKSRFQLETYVFNPPFISVPIESLIKNKTLKHGVLIFGSLAKAGIATAMNLHHKDPEKDPFNMLSEWTPNVFVNPSDPICAEYIRYFQQRETMEENGAKKIEMIATKHSIRSLFSSATGRDSEPLHLLPTACITVNLSPYGDWKQAHGIEQWWKQHFHWQSKLYKFN